MSPGRYTPTGTNESIPTYLAYSGPPINTAWHAAMIAIPLPPAM